MTSFHTGAFEPVPSAGRCGRITPLPILAASTLDDGRPDRLPPGGRGVAATRIGPSGVHTCSRADAKAVQVFAGTLAERARRATDDFAVRTTASAVIGVAIGVWRTEVDGPTRNLALFEAGLASRRRSPAVSPTSSDQAPAHGCRSRSTRCRVFHDRLAAATPLRPAWPCICPHVGGTAPRSGQPPSAGPPHGGGERDAAGGREPYWSAGELTAGPGTPRPRWHCCTPRSASTGR